MLVHSVITHARRKSRRLIKYQSSIINFSKNFIEKFFFIYIYIYIYIYTGAQTRSHISTLWCVGQYKWISKTMLVSYMNGFRMYAYACVCAHALALCEHINLCWKVSLRICIYMCTLEYD
jgi:hypothetical protein